MVKPHMQSSSRSVAWKLGAVEVKPFLPFLVDIDNAIVRLGKITKRMLQVRVSKAKSEREFFTFGVMVYGSVVEYYIHQYHLSAAAASSSTSTLTPTPSPVYTFELIKSCTLPTLPTTFIHMYLSLEYLIYCKKLMEDSLAEK